MIDAQEKITIILDYFLDHKDKQFDTTYVYDLQSKLDEYGSLTKSQERALENIICSWKILI